jgi:hypothetical protein
VGVRVFNRLPLAFAQMTTPSKNLEQNSARGELHVRALGYLALFEGEGESEGSGPLPMYARFEPLTSILSPCSRGEAEEISISTLMR